MKTAIYDGAIPSTTFIENLIEALANNGQQVLLFGRLKNNIHYQSKNIKCYPTPGSTTKLIFFVCWNRFKLRWLFPKRYRLLRSHILTQTQSNSRRWRLWGKYLPVVHHLPDIFHIQWAKSAAEWLFLKELFDVKLVLSLRGSHINYSPIANEQLADSYKRIFPLIDGFHSVSKEIAATAQQYNASTENVKVIYSGIDIHNIAYYQKSNYSISGNIKMLSVGRFHWVKGYNYALDSIKRLKDSGITCHYSIIAGEPTEEIIFQINDLNLNEYVEIIDQLPHESIFKRMQSADLLLLTSVQEGIANVVLEAMAVGLPVVSSDCGGMSEVIDNEINGLLFQNRNVADMAVQLEKMINYSPEDRERMAMLARQRVTEQFGADRLGEEMAAFYEEVCKKN